MVIIERPNLRLEWIEPDNILKKTCSGFVTSEALREVYEAGLAELVRRRVSKVLSDNRELVPAPQDMLEWIEKDWTPRMAHAGWRHWAVIEPANPLGAMSARRWIQIYRRHRVQVEVFHAEPEALAWLRAQPVEAQAAAPRPRSPR